MKRARLLVSQPIDDALTALEERAGDEVEWGSPHVAQTIRQCVKVVRSAIRESLEVGLSTQRMSEASGWSENTLKKWAKLIEDGRQVPHPWNRMEVYRDALGNYAFKASTVPPKTVRDAA